MLSRACDNRTRVTPSCVSPAKFFREKGYTQINFCPFMARQGRRSLSRKAASNLTLAINYLFASVKEYRTVVEMPKPCNAFMFVDLLEHYVK